MRRGRTSETGLTGCLSVVLVFVGIVYISNFFSETIKPAASAAIGNYEGNTWLWVLLISVIFIVLCDYVFKGNRKKKYDERIREIGLEQIDVMEGAEFEQFIGELLEDLGCDNVNVTKKSGDQGVDVIATLGGVTYAVQCKRSSGTVGNKAVQEVVSGMYYYPECTQGVVITNSFFTNSAEDLAKKASVRLWNRDTLKGLIQDRLDGIEYTTDMDFSRYYKE